MATTLTYGDVILHNVLTERWDQEITYDESGTDMIGQKHTIRVRGILHAQRVPITNSKTYITHVPQPATVFTLLDNVRSLLFQPRQKLEIKIAGNSVLVVNPPNANIVGADTDVNNGPKPRHVEVTPIGRSAFRVQPAVSSQANMLPARGTRASMEICRLRRRPRRPAAVLEA